MTKFKKDEIYIDYAAGSKAIIKVIEPCMENENGEEYMLIDVFSHEKRRWMGTSFPRYFINLHNMVKVS